MKTSNIRDLCKGVLSLNNAKLNHMGNRLGLKVAAFDLPAGYTCPAASLCHSRADIATGHLTDYGVFRCYAAKAESQYKNTRAMRHSNLDLTRDVDSFIDRISEILRTGKIDVIRIHASGDFYNPKYYQAWRTLANLFPSVKFFAYTKLANIAKDAQQTRPLDNLKIVYSMGGKMDKLAIEWNLVTCTVITSDFIISEDESQFVNHLKDDKIERITCNKILSDDYEAVMNQESFGIILH